MRLRPIILGVLAAIGSLGCQKASQGLSPATGASLTYPAPAEAERGDEANAAGETHPAETAAREELGDEAAEKLKIEPRQPPTPAEPGALALVASMTAAMPDRETDDEGVTRIGIHFLRNQSRAEASEFDAFTKRLAELLSAAGRSLSVSFTTAGDEPVQYELLGAAYLITADGSDQWELFLRLCPAEESWTVWENEVPVRVIRQPRPGQPQITQWPLAQ